MRDNIVALDKAYGRIYGRSEEPTPALLAQETGWTEERVLQVEEARFMGDDLLSLPPLATMGKMN